jgi:hypothetical protein
MKYARAWEWENVWLVYSIFGLVLFPWIIAAWTVPDVADILRASPRGALAVPFWFGTLGIVIGLTSALGSFVPLLLLYPGRLRDTGLFVGASVLVTLVGLGLCTAAGLKRERCAGRDQTFRHGSFWTGIADLSCGDSTRGCGIQCSKSDSRYCDDRWSNPYRALLRISSVAEKNLDALQGSWTAV